ncbi:uncharacterized protein [Mobula birostris]|uniref:uncharacterized protein n=1 Tax=Mobula birostris TaxID=1983395 RepID=UPI003B2867B0
MGNCCKKAEKKEGNKELGEMEENKTTKNEEILYATIDHSKSRASIEENPSPSACEYAVINYHHIQETTISEQDTQEYEEVLPR